jgi:hypothetical protein
MITGNGEEGLLYKFFFQDLPEVTEVKNETSGLQTHNQSSNL